MEDLDILDGFYWNGEDVKVMKRASSIWQPCWSRHRSRLCAKPIHISTVLNSMSNYVLGESMEKARAWLMLIFFQL